MQRNTCRRLFAEGNDTRALDLVDTKQFSLGIIILEYRSAKKG